MKYCIHHNICHSQTLITTDIIYDQHSYILTLLKYTISYVPYSAKTVSTFTKDSNRQFDYQSSEIEQKCTDFCVDINNQHFIGEEAKINHVQLIYENFKSIFTIT